MAAWAAASRGDKLLVGDPSKPRGWAVIGLAGAGGLPGAVTAAALPGAGLVGAELAGIGAGATGRGAELRLVPPKGGVPLRVQSKGLVLKRLTWGALAMAMRCSTQLPFHGSFAAM